MTQFNAQSYDIARSTGQCAVTGRVLEPGEQYMAALVEVDANILPHSDTSVAPAAADPPPAAPANSKAAAALGMRRLDFSMEAWQQQEQRPAQLFSYWKSTVRQPNQKKRVFVDDQVLVDLFRRLADSEDQQRLAFRFVVGLILMRKRLLKYEGTQSKKLPDGNNEEWWQIVIKGDAEPSLLLNPHLDEQQIQQVSEQLGQILDGEL